MTATLDTLIARVRAQFGHFAPGTITHIATDTPAQPASHAMILEWLGDGLILERVPAAWARAHYHTADPYPPPDVPPVKLIHAHIDERGVDFAMRHPIVPTIAEHLAKAFRDEGGVNYVTWEINHSELGRLSLRMQRAEGETPEAQARRLREENERLRGVLAGVRVVLKDCYDVCHDSMTLGGVRSTADADENEWLTEYEMALAKIDAALNREREE